MWDWAREQPVRVFSSGHRTTVTCLDYHPFGDFLITGSQDTFIKVWDVKNKVCLQTYKEHTRTVNCVKFSPDGRWAASGAGDGVVKLWDLTAGKCLREFLCHTGEITSLEFHPREFLLAIGSADRTCSLWDLDRFELTARSVADATPVKRLAFLPERNSVVVATSDSVKLFDCGTQGTLQPQEMFQADWGNNLQDLVVNESTNVASGLTFEGSYVSVSQVKLTAGFRGPSVEVKTPKPRVRAANPQPPPQQQQPPSQPHGGHSGMSSQPATPPSVQQSTPQSTPTRKPPQPKLEVPRTEPEEELVSSMLNQSTHMKRLLDARLSTLRMLRSLWSRDPKAALTHIHQLLDQGSEDVGAVVDFLSLMQHQRMKEKVAVENITLMLGAVLKILNGTSRYERYLVVVMRTARSLNNIFKARIETVLRAERHMGIGVDISMEQRVEKARAARQMLENIGKSVSQYINRSDSVGEEARTCAAELAGTSV
eukprot:PhM_4_TR9140/c0_g1_i1/m.90218/K18643/KATNB1; katanin p80 WD40 repeat-containing subunit B1